jgi:GST-like protein
MKERRMARKIKKKAPKKVVRKAAKPARATARRKQEPIDLYYWATPNGWKISIMLEECALPYKVRFVNIGRGDQFKPDFLKIAPNNRMPAIVDPNGPGGKPISVFESGAILQYLARKTGKFYSKDERKRVEIDEWLFWQMANLGPMAGQAHHFRLYAPEKLPYAIERYTNECRRLYGVLEKKLAGREYICGDYSIADMACVGWTKPWERQGQDPNDFPNVKAWLARVMARPAVVRGMAIKADPATVIDATKDKAAFELLFRQGAKK